MTVSTQRKFSNRFVKLSLCFLCFLVLIFRCSSGSALELNISGIDNNDIEENIRLFANQVKKPSSELAVDDYQLELNKNITKAVHAFSYYDANVKIEPITFTQPENLEVDVHVELNEITKVSNVILQTDIIEGTQGYKNIPQDLLNVIQKVRQFEGKPLNQNTYDQLKNQLSTYAVLYGYFDFNFILHKLSINVKQSDSENQEMKSNTAAKPQISEGASDTSVQPAKQKSYAIVHWIFNLNERYLFGELNFLKETRGQHLAEKVKPFKSGQFFDQSKIGEFSLNMASTGYFDNAIARANSTEANDLQVPIEVILQPKPKDLYQFGVGFSTDTRTRLSVDWRRPWVNLDGHELGAKLYLSNPRRSISLDYRIPKANPLNDFLNYRVTLKQTDENQTQSDNASFEILRQWGATEDDEWDQIGFITIERESFIQGIQPKQTTTLLMPGFTLTRTRKVGDIFVDWGDRQQLTIQTASKSIVSDIDLFKVLATTKWIREYSNHRFTLRADAGAIATDDFSRVPSSHRFFAGGDQSVRGFGFNELSEFEFVEQDGEITTELIGGKYLAVASVEYAYRVAEDWRVATFIDVGNATDEFARDLATGVGIGAHWLSPIGNVQFYIARGESKIENTWRVHLMIGPGL